jgi:hypothetical protein
MAWSSSIILVTEKVFSGKYVQQGDVEQVLQGDCRALSNENPVPTSPIGFFSALVLCKDFIPDSMKKL